MANPTSKIILVINDVTTQLDVHDANAVDLSSNQTVGGIKTFSNAPVVNSINLDGKTIDTDANDNMTFNSHIVNTIEEQGNSYIRYSSGLQICWGGVGIGSQVTITFPKSFLNRPAVAVSANSPDANSIMNTVITAQVVTVYNNYAYYGGTYIAIGRWK